MTDPHYPWLRPTDEGIELLVWVVPGSSRSGIAGVHNGLLRVRLAAPPSGGQANALLLRYLRRVLGTKPTLLSGTRSRQKTLLIRGVSADDAARKLGRASSDNI